MAKKKKETEKMLEEQKKKEDEEQKRKEEEKKSFVINKGSLNITEKFVEDIMDYTIDEPYFMDTIEDMIKDDEISVRIYYEKI